MTRFAMTAITMIYLPLAAATADGDKPSGDDSRIGQKIDAFRLQDFRGAWHTLDEFRDSKLVVVAFVGNECPLAKQYAPRVVELADEFGPKGVAFVGINANRQDAVTEMANYARANKIEFPLLKDVGNVVADQFGAKRTPEVFVLDSERKVRYRGRVDDQFGLAHARPRPTSRDLATALEELLDGKPVTKPAVEPEGCFIGRMARRDAKRDANGDANTVTYSNQIARLVQKRCAGCHHPGDIAPFSLLSYSDVAGWSETIREVVREQRMPPWHANPKFGVFSNDARMPDAEKQLIYDWVKNGCPEGDPRDLPEPVEFVAGWKIPKPDRVITMPRPYKVQATGTVDYQYFEVDPGFTEGKWIQAAEARPDNRSVVHHVVMFVQPPGGAAVALSGGSPFDILAATAPGMPPQICGDGMAKFVPAGAKLVFQMHYTPCGTEQTDQSSLGLVFADPKKVRKEVKSGAALNMFFRIPPGAKDHKIEGTHKFSQDTLLYSLLPHMHLRGKSFTIEAIYPDNTRETLLDVPRYEFAWQHIYQLAEPKLMPEGTRLRCEGHFDNSEDNPQNPDPKAAVTFGLQTREEMMVGLFEASLADQDLTLGPPRVTPLGDDTFEVLFRYRPPAGATTVHLAGTFNDWKTDAHSMSGPDPDGMFTTRLELKPGPYEYKFFIDGKTWKHDPGNRQQKGLYNNSMVAVGAP